MSSYDRLTPNNISIPTVHSLFEQGCRKVPEATAVQFGDGSITYTQLDNLSRALAEAILAQAPNDPIVAISTTRNIGMVIGVLAILRSGKAYLPLDPAYPQERLQQICTDSQITLALCSREEFPLFTQFGLKTLDTAENYPTPSGIQPPTPPSLAYVLYTSGSTGTPKGVCMGHGPLVNLLLWQQKNSTATAGTRTLQFAPLSFDVSFQEIFATLATGGTLILIQDELRLDPKRLLHFIQDNRVNRIFLPFVALQFLTESADAENFFPSSLTEVMTAGEQLKVTPQVRRFFSALPGCVLLNQYGPTECHVVTELRLEGDPAAWPALPSIGIPIDNTSILIIDEQGKLLPGGETGELCITGSCLAEGYLRRPELTAEKFATWAHPTNGPIRIYKTGDLARFLPDGNIDYLGRRDDQVKIRGYRIELGEIEVLLNEQPGILQAVVVAREDVPGQKKLVAYLVSADGNKDLRSIRKAVSDHLPDYMMPSAFVWMGSFPKTTSGKVDKKALPKPENKRPDLAIPYAKPTSPAEQQLAGLWASLLQIDRVGRNDNFFELGGNSLLALKTVANVQTRFSWNLPITRIYQFPTIAGICQWLEGGRSTHGQNTTTKPRKTSNTDNDIAVIGLAGRFPGAADITELWTVLKEGRETTAFFSPDELHPSIPPEEKNDPSYVCARGILDDAAAFDAAYFGISPRLAELMDPQQRIFLETAVAALENGGYGPGTYNGSIGVFAGSGNNSYYLNNVLQRKDLVDKAGSFHVMTYNEKDYVASRTSFVLNLTGPAVSVHSGCSTSLLAVAQAVQSLRDGQCDMALAGGVAVTAPIKSGHIYHEGAMLSKDGHCRPFDSQAQGTVFSDGAGAVLLKTKEAAIRDGDTIYAIIKGIGVNNDGGTKGSFTAPSAEGQADAIRKAIDDAAIAPTDISYIEAHGTATPLGDPIEIEGLTMAFGPTPINQYCAIGSVKSNFGHLTAAAGIAGMIKTILSLRHKQIPPSINFEHPNPNIDFNNSPFFVNSHLRDWTPAGQRIAGVSSFGVGGTNVHLILEEWDQQPNPGSKSRPAQLIAWSAQTAKSLDAYGHDLSHWLDANPSIDLADLAYTLDTTRAAAKHRGFIIAADTAELKEKLRSTGYSPHHLLETPTDLVFMFPGQGSQYTAMGAELYQHEPVFRETIDECAELLEPMLEADIRTILYPANPSTGSDAIINNTFYTQPALFAVELALAKLWISWGITPSAFIGHSIGEFVAAHLAGVFDLRDALLLVASRGRLMADLPTGDMIAVQATHETIIPLLPPDVAIAAVNSPGSCVVSGPAPHILELTRLLENREISVRPLYTSHAFHSPMMDPIIEPFGTIVHSIKLNIPRIPIASTVGSGWLSDTQATDPAYWINHIRATVKFSDGLRFLIDNGYRLMLEVGPRAVTTSFARRQLAAPPVLSIASLHPQEYGSDYRSMLNALGQLWLNGFQPDWKAFFANEERRKMAIPTYAFEPTRYWVDPISAPVATNPIQTPAASASPENQLTVTQTLTTPMRKQLLADKIRNILEDASGIDLTTATPGMSFIEMGMDSLLLTQVSLHLKKEFGLPITFRQLNEEYGTLEQLAAFLDANLPADKYAPAPQAAQTTPLAPQTAGPQPHYPAQPALAVNYPLYTAPPSGNDNLLGLIARQIQLLGQQLSLLQGDPGAMPPPAIPAQTTAVHAAAAPAPRPAATPAQDNGLTKEEIVELKKPFGASARIEKHATTLSTTQQTFLSDLIARYNKKTAGSKAYTAEHRPHMADPRVVSGFRPLTKEIVYSLVVNRSKGSRLWDIDGNEYIDALNGFGSNMLGYQPDIIKKAVWEQMENGYELGPQHELAGPVCQLICEFTNFDRAALCNTGSEAVLGAMRIARTVTGRSTIVAFSGSYHGIVDEVIVRGTKKLKSFPAAPGIMPEAVQNMLILDYGTDESLRIITERAHELAAVLVEPVQSRRPEYQPIEFLKKVREITAASGAALIFDEVITGFRMHPGGAQALFGIQADLGTYGKVVAGGMPIGVIAGKRTFMDALDGGAWNYGDNSTPEAGVTYFAGTFVRHPLALAASKASLEYMKAKGPALQENLTQKAARLADGINAVCQHLGLACYAAQFGSLWKLKWKEEIPYSELIFTLMREKGIHIWDGFPCFITEAHTDQEIDTIVEKFTESVTELVAAGFLPSATRSKGIVGKTIEEIPPRKGARIGRDPQGNPAWFIADPDRPGKYLQLN
ncbi:MAG TPA: amino acid adenylation domain-containing protein [Puia sp.]|nr:amino acid adenylation domain-containing protein [Puia sp.]